MARITSKNWVRSSECPHDEEKETGGPTKPDGNKDTCQCVMCHCGGYVDGTIWQCNNPRWEESNQFCQGCEEMHGEKWRKMYGKESSK